MIDVSIIAVPEAGTSMLGAAELFKTVGVVWNELIESRQATPAYRTRIVGETREPLACSNHWTAHPDTAIADVDRTDIVFIPSLWITPGGTFAGRHGPLKDWITRQYRGGAIVCASCTGVLLLADTGLLDGESATVHWAYEDGMREHYPRVALHTDKVLVESGADGRLITSGSHATWYDALLYLICRTSGREAALHAAKFFLLQWHIDGQTPYRAFQERLAHDDAVIRECQNWLRGNYSHPTPVDAVEQQSGIAPRSFKRRFRNATGMTPLAYVQELRVEQAKSLLETSDTAIDEVGWRIGYEDVAFFRRLFKRLTGLTPRDYRRKFRLPQPEVHWRGGEAASAAVR